MHRPWCFVVPPLLVMAAAGTVCGGWVTETFDAPPAGGFTQDFFSHNIQGPSFWFEPTWWGYGDQFAMFLGTGDQVTFATGPGRYVDQVEMVCLTNYCSGGFIAMGPGFTQLYEATNYYPPPADPPVIGTPPVNVGEPVSMLLLSGCETQFDNLRVHVAGVEEITGATGEVHWDPAGHEGFGTQGTPPGASLVGGTVTIEDFVLTDDFATIRLFYDPAELAAGGIDEGSLLLYWWYDENDNRTFWWTAPPNTWRVAGNEGNLADNSADPDYLGFVLGAPTDTLGDWGRNEAENYVWANVDHASAFGMAGVPEPLALSLLAVGGAAVLAARRVRRGR
jgi:hypothetical protein